MEYPEDEHMQTVSCNNFVKEKKKEKKEKRKKRKREKIKNKEKRKGKKGKKKKKKKNLQVFLGHFCWLQYFSLFFFH